MSARLTLRKFRPHPASRKDQQHHSNGKVNTTPMERSTSLLGQARNFIELIIEIELLQIIMKYYGFHT